MVNVTYLAPGEYTVTFAESGLPSGTDWSVTLGSSQRSASTSSIIFVEANGTYGYRIGPVTGRYTNRTAGSVVVDGFDVTQGLQWNPPPTYLVNFTETGLPAHPQWWVNLSGINSGYMASSSILFYEPNGTYNYSVQRLYDWETTRYEGSITVDGAPVNVTVAWVAIVSYNITFQETGLPNGTAWNVSLPGSVTPTLDWGSESFEISFSEPNGTYAFAVTATYGEPGAYLADPSSGVVTVQGRAQTVAIAFALNSSYFPVTFEVTDPDDAAGWNLILGGQSYYSTLASVMVPERNGTYAYSIYGPTGSRPTPPRERSRSRATRWGCRSSSCCRRDTMP